MRDALAPAIIGFVAVLAFLGAMISLKVWIDSSRCDARWPTRETQWGFFSGCLVKTDNGFVAQDRIWFEKP